MVRQAHHPELVEGGRLGGIKEGYFTQLRCYDFSTAESLLL